MCCNVNCFGSTESDGETTPLSSSIVVSDQHNDEPDGTPKMNGVTPNEKSSENFFHCWKFKVSRNTIYGYIAVFAVMFIGIFSMGCVQSLARSVPHSELNGFRYLLHLVLSIPIVGVYRKCDVYVERDDVLWMVLYCAASICNNYGVYGMVYYLAIGDACAITASLVITANFSIKSIIHKQILFHELFTSIICISGVILVTQPQFMFHQTDGSSHENSTGEQPACQLDISPTNFSSANWNDETEIRHKFLTIGYSLTVLAALSYIGGGQVAHRKMAHINMYVTSFWLGLSGTITSFVIMSISEVPYFPHKDICIVLFVCHVISAALNAFLVFKAFQLLEPFIVSLLYTLEILLTLLLQYSLLSGIILGNRNLYDIFGILLIFIGNVITPLYHIISNCSNPQ